MKIFGFPALSYYLLTFFSLFSFGCKQPVSTSAEVVETPDKTYYYPSANIYFNTATNTYQYSLDSGKKWISFIPPAAADTPVLGARYEVTAEDGRPAWEQNQKHMNAYNGSMWAVISADTGRNKSEKIAKAAVIAVKKQPEEPQTVEKKKNNIFQKVFGKKKKNN